MGVRIASQSTQGTIGAQTQNALETVLARVGPINLTVDNAFVQIFWYLLVSLGTNATATTIRVRRSTAAVGAVNPTGTIVNQDVAAITGAAGDVKVCSGFVTDAPGIGAEILYAITVQNTGQTVAANVNDVQAFAMVL